MAELLKTQIAIRAYSERPNRKPLGSRPTSTDFEASEWTLVFDCETTVDASQQLRFGFFQIWQGDRRHREGVFFVASALSGPEQTLLRRYCRSRQLELIPVAEFRADIFLE